MILDTRNYQDSVDALVEAVKAKMVEAGADIREVVNKGQLKFQRVTDRKFPAGLYLQVSFDAPTTAPEKIRSKFSLDATINRILIEHA
ncbi:MAG: 30S ribosomal protein S6 [Opitutales bacterium]|nr:30S ribosomal protein S6 [Opitutales bacterium]